MSMTGVRVTALIIMAEFPFIGRSCLDTEYGRGKSDLQCLSKSYLKITNMVVQMSLACSL